MKINKNSHPFSHLIGRTISIPQIDWKYFIKNSFWVGIRQIITLAVGLLVSVAFTRLVTKELYGSYELILSILSLISITAISGLNPAIIRAVARGYEGGYPKAVKISFLWSFLGSAIVFIIGGFYFLYQSEVVGIVLLASSIFFPFLYGLSHWEAFFSGQERFDLATKFSALQAIISGLATAFVIFLFPDKLIIIALAHFLLSSGFNILFYKKSLFFLKNRKTEKGTISYGYFLTKINVLSMVANHLDKIIVGVFLGPQELAIYAIGVNFSKKILDLIKSFFSIATPKIAKKNTVNKQNYFKIFALFSIFAIGAYFISPSIILFLFSENYSNSIILSQIVLLFMPFYALNLLYKNHILFYLKNKKTLLLESIIFPLIIILLTAPLLYFFKIKGLAFIFGARSAINLLTLYLLQRRSK
jgi:O-antigen/teichoic acid export membrane protein